MYTFSKNSLKHLDTLHPDLKLLMSEAIKYYDFAIICGYRGETDQNHAFAIGTSKVKYPFSRHNLMPSRAVDIIPSGNFDWKDTKRFAFMMGAIYLLAKQLGIKIKFGLDFNNDGVLTNDSFQDFPHIQLED